MEKKLGSVGPERPTDEQQEDLAKQENLATREEGLDKESEGPEGGPEKEELAEAKAEEIKDLFEEVSAEGKEIEALVEKIEGSDLSPEQGGKLAKLKESFSSFVKEKTTAIVTTLSAVVGAGGSLAAISHFTEFSFSSIPPGVYILGMVIVSGIGYAKTANSLNRESAKEAEAYIEGLVAARMAEEKEKLAKQA